jgi:hypothetical protein
MKIFKLLVTAVILPLFACAQSNYKPGYVITAKGDTISGYIDQREWLSTPTSLKFKKDLKADYQSVTANDVRYANIGNLETYITYSGPITMDRISESTMMLERDTSVRTGTFFLKVEQQGKNVNLYSFSDRVKTRYFITDKDNPTPTELIYRLYYDSEKVTMFRGRTVNENTYMKQLFDLLNMMCWIQNFNVPLKNRGMTCTTSKP